MLWLGFANEAAPESEDAPKSAAGAAPLPPEEEEDDVNVASEVTDVISVIMPWAISVLLHAGVALLAIFFAWTSIQAKEEDEEEVIIPIARLSATPGAPVSMRVSKTTSRTTTSSMARSVSTAVSSAATGGGPGIGGGTGGGNSGGLIGLGGGGGGGRGSPFGSGIASGGAFKATFYGTGGNARRIVYMVDASGSLIDTLPFVILELKRSIGELSEQQEFTVIFFQGSEPKEVRVPTAGLKKANSENKAKVIDWMDTSKGNIIPQGLGNPVNAIKLALQYKPHLMFLLSDDITGKGMFQVDQRHLLRAVESANVGGTKINTIQFLYTDPLTKVGLEPTMKLIAEQTGGIYKYLDGRELGIQ